MNPREIDTTQRPFVLIWELTQACELACKHCRADAEPHRHPDELTTDEGRQLIKGARRFGEGQLGVLSGGDPLARDDTTELVDYGADIGLRMTLTPSGTTSLTSGRIQELADAGLRRMGITAGNGFAFVSHVGDVYPSGFLPQAAGTVRAESIVEMYRDSEPFRSLRDPDALRGKCGVCEYRHVCGGSRSRAFAYSQDPLASDPLCAYIPEEYNDPLPEQSVATQDASSAD